MSLDLDLTAAAQAQIDACTACGLCLEACPTYTLAGFEPDSPRGRLALLAGALADTPPHADPALTEHIDACIGCRLCVSACPEDVHYATALDAARGLVRGGRSGTPLRRARETLLRTTLSSPRRLRTLAPSVAAARRAQTARAPEPIQTLSALPLGSPSARQLTAAINPFTPARAPRRGHVALLLGCTERVFSSDLQRTAVAVLAAEGFDVSAPLEPSCCGGWGRELGDIEAWHQTARHAGADLARIGGVDGVLTVAGRCTASLLDAPAGGSQVQDLIAFLAAAGPQAPRGRLTWQVARHTSCQQRRDGAVPRADPTAALLSTVPGLEAAGIVDTCCGGHGLYPARRPTGATALRERALTALVGAEGDAQAIVSDEPACAEHLRRGLRARGRDLPVLHPLEVLWLALQAA